MLAKAADPSVRGESTAFDREVQEELDVLQLNESVPYVSIQYVKKAIKAEREERWLALGTDRGFVGRCARRRHTGKMC